MVAAELKVVGGKHAGQVIPLNRRKFLIGREQDCQLRPNSDMVSRHHCVFSVDDFSVRLRDLGSTNGTLVNGERIRKETVLTAGDRIVIGNLDFELVIRSGVSVSETDSKPASESTLTNEDTQVTSRTVLEIPTAPLTTPDVSVSSTQAVPAQSLVQPASASPVPASPAETAVIPAAQMMPGQYPYQPMMQPMGYPGGMYGNMPYQPMMPGYGQMYPQMYPQMMPQQMMPQQMGYPAQQPMVEAPQSAPAGAIEVALPDPSTTGAREAEVAKGSTGAAPTDTAKPTGAADAIIKQYMGKRPGNS